MPVNLEMSNSGSGERTNSVTQFFAQLNLLVQLFLQLFVEKTNVLCNLYVFLSLGLLLFAILIYLKLNHTRMHAPLLAPSIRARAKLFIKRKCLFLSYLSHF